MKALSISARFAGAVQYIIVLAKFDTLSKLPSRTKLPLILLQNFALRVPPLPPLKEIVYLASTGTGEPLYETILNTRPLRLDAEGILGTGV